MSALEGFNFEQLHNLPRGDFGNRAIEAEQSPFTIWQKRFRDVQDRVLLAEARKARSDSIVIDRGPSGKRYNPEAVSKYGLEIGKNVIKRALGLQRIGLRNPYLSFAVAFEGDIPTPDGLSMVRKALVVDSDDKLDMRVLLGVLNGIEEIENDPRRSNLEIISFLFSYLKSDAAEELKEVDFIWEYEDGREEHKRSYVVQGRKLL